MVTKQQLLKVYDHVVGGHAEYQQMIREMARMAKGRVLEVGAGTGLLTEQLLKNKAITKLVLIEPDVSFVKKFKENLPRLKVFRKNGLTFRSKQKFDFIVMSLVYHHISDAKKKAFLRNMRLNLRQSGTLVIGDVFLLPYKNELERNHSLMLFHEARIRRATDRVAKEVEQQSLVDGLKRSVEYKTSYEVLEIQLKEVGFTSAVPTKFDGQTTGGYMIVAANKRS